MILFRIRKYLEHLFLASGCSGYGIHSQFVFDIVTRVFKKKATPGLIRRVRKYRKDLLADKRFITITDLGSLSSVRTVVSARVSDRARLTSVPEKYGVLLMNMAEIFGTSGMLELGTSFGVSTMYLALADTRNTVHTIEGCPETSSVAREYLDREGVKNVDLLTGPFEEILPLLIAGGISPGLVFIDGNHRKKPVISYFEALADIPGDSTVIIIDDINYSREMAEAWNIIREHPKVTVSIDLFRMGILFFRKGLMRRNYMIRY